MKVTEYDIRDYDLYENHIAVYMQDDTTINIDRIEFKGLDTLDYVILARTINIINQRENKENENMTAGEVYCEMIDIIERLGTEKKIQVEVIKSVGHELVSTYCRIESIDDLELKHDVLTIGNKFEVKRNDIAEVDCVISVCRTLLNIQLWEAC